MFATLFRWPAIDSAPAANRRTPQSGGKSLLEVPGYRFQALWTNLGPEVSALQVWRRYNGRADVENRIKELGEQFGIKRLTVRNFWAPRRCIT